MATLTRWLLRAFADEWTGGLPSDLRLADRDDSYVLNVDTGTDPTTLSRAEHTTDWDLSRGNILGVALTDEGRDPAGLGGTEYRAEPTLTVRIEAAHEDQHGAVADADAFMSLVREAIAVVQRIDNGTLQGAPTADFHVADPGDQSPRMSDAKDYYRYDFDVAARGYETV
jgi:hypothetical protein